MMRRSQGNTVPVRRPHFELRGEDLYFLRSKRPYATLDRTTADVWRSVDGHRTVEFLASDDNDRLEALTRLHTLGVVELVPPPPAAPRTPVLVIEPHMDDAILSVGGSMAARREACEFTLVTLAGRSNFTSYYLTGVEFFDVHEVSTLRRAESALAMRLLGGRHEACDLAEGPLRCRPGDWTLEWYRRHAKLVDAQVAHPAPSHEVDSWADVVEEIVSSTPAEEIWLPLGVGSHVDHELARNACLEALRRRPRLGREARLLFYPEVPYLNRFGAHASRILNELRDAGMSCRPIPMDIAGSFEAKKRLVSIYASQFKPAFMLPQVEEAALGASPDGSSPYELLVEVERMRDPPDPLTLYSGRERVETLASDMKGWFARHRAASKLRVLSAEPVPRLTDDLGELRRAFPNATIELHVRMDHLPPDRETEDPGVLLAPVRGHRLAWARRLARLASGSRAPTLVVTGPTLRRWRLLLHAAFGRRWVSTGETMGDLALAIGLLQQRDSDDSGGR